MIKHLSKLIAISVIAISVIACSEEEESTPTPTPTPTPKTYNTLKVFTNLQFGGQENPSLPSFCVTDSGKLYGTTATSASLTLQARVDLAYFYTTSQMACIAGPLDSLALAAHQGNSSMPNWTWKNNTRFYKTNYSVADYNAITKDSIFTVADTALITSSRITNLAVDNVLAFKTVKGKYGLIHISAISGVVPSQRALTMNIKVQK